MYVYVYMNICICTTYRYISASQHVFSLRSVRIAAYALQKEIAAARAVDRRERAAVERCASE